MERIKYYQYIEMQKEKKYYKGMKKSLLILMLLDFLLTYIGIHNYGFIAEGNPYLVWLFELPFIPSVIIRIVQIFFIFFVITYVEMKSYKYYKFLIGFAVVANSIIVLVHFVWMYKMLQPLI